MAAQEAVKAILTATREGDVGEVVRLLDAQPDLMEANDPLYNRSLLYEPARKGHADVVRVLLARGADVNRGDSMGRTPLYMAAVEGHEDVAIVLLRAGADIRLMGKFRLWSPLTNACYEGHLGVTRLLLRHMRGEGLDDKAEAGKTALWWACDGGRAEVCRALLLAGADDTIEDDDGETPRQIAQQEQDNPCTAVFEVGALTTSRRLETNDTIVKII
jgi:ankyrin repeat protein